jgi:hypothetical protein
LEIPLVGRARILVLVAVIALAAGTLADMPAVASAAPTPVSSVTLPTPQDSNSASTESSASAIARDFHHSVIVDSDTTPTTQISALPDGTMQMVENTIPVRVKLASGWVAVDPTLKSANDGFLAPTAVNTPVEFSAGGSTVLAKIRTTGGGWLQETSPFGVLPAPTVEGAVATYSDVLPGVDLQLTATAGGMTEVMVIKSATAAANPLLKAVAFTVSGTALTSTANGLVTATAPDGSKVLSTTPMWWDSSEGSDATGPAGTTFSEPVQQTAAGSSITLNAQAATSSRAVEYPVYIDPDWTGGLEAYTYVDKAYPSQLYWDGQYATGEQRTGYVNAANSPDNRNHTARSLWQVDTSAVEGKNVTKAVFTANLNGWFNCTASEIDLYQSAVFTSATDWTNQPGTIQYLGDSSPGCTAGAYGFTATAGVQAAAAAGAGSLDLELKAANEAVNTSWKKFTQSASITITYETVPSIPASPIIASPVRSCGTLSAPALVNGTVPLTLQAAASDPDGGNLASTFSVYKSSGGASVWSLATPPEAQSAQSVMFPANSTTLTLGQPYYWSAVSSDGIGTSPASTPCYFELKNSNPAPPTVSPISVSRSVGAPMTVQFTATASDDAASFAYWWADGSPASPGPSVPNPLATTTSPIPADGSAAGGVRYASVVGSTNQSAVLTVAPIDTSSTLYVATFDGAGNVSSTASYTRTVGASPTVDNNVDGHQWLLEGLLSLSGGVPDTNSITGSGLTSQSNLTVVAPTNTGFTDSWAAGFPTPMFDFTASPTQLVHSAQQVVDTTKSFTASAWVEPAALPGAGKFETVLAQQGATNSGFALQLNSAGNWQFCIRPQVAGGTTDCAVSSAVATLGASVMVTGVWDAANNQVRLLINDQLTAAAVRPHTVPTGDTSSTGYLLVGSDYIGGVTASQWNGEIDDTAIFPGVIDTAELNYLFSFSTNDTAPATPTATFDYPFGLTCGTAASPGLVNGTTEIGSEPSTADSTGDDLITWLGIYGASGGSPVLSVVTPSEAPGSFSVYIPANTAALVPGNEYYMSAVSTDGISNSAASTPCYFQIKDTNPSLPTVTVTSAATTVGAPMQVQFTTPPSDGVVTFEYWWADGAPAGSGPAAPSSGYDQTYSITNTPGTSTPASFLSSSGVSSVNTVGSTGKSPVVTVAPIDTSSTLYVEAFDAAGNSSLSGTALSTGLAVSATPSPTVNYTSGHEWNTDALTSLPNPVLDSNIANSGSTPPALTDRATLSLAAGVNTTTRDFQTGHTASSSVFSFTASPTQIVTTSHQIIDTTKSFTATAWVDPKALPAAGQYETAMAETGSNTSAFTLRLDSSGFWEFCIALQVGQNSSVYQTCAYSLTVAQLNTWTQVTGIWDSANDQVRLMEGDTLIGQAPNEWYTGSPTTPTGDLLVGSDNAAGISTSQWVGEIDDPAVFPGVIDSTQLTNLSQFKPVN